MTDESYIKLAIEIAKKGMGSVAPNPLVGCVIIKNERIIGAGFHEKFGGKHAEINAIESAIENVDGGTMYINLEPCSHQGLTPPCANRIIESKIKRVVVGTLDMNPLVSGRGIKKLKSAGIDVKVGILENECVNLNKFFFKYILSGIPYVTIKVAQTLDGRIADEHGQSKWITSPQSRKFVHELRSKYDAVLVGAGTVKQDDPNLTVRLVEGRNPRRIIIDSNLSIRSTNKLYLNNSDKKLIIVTSVNNLDKKNKLKRLTNAGAHIIFVNEDEKKKLNLKEVLKELGKIKISSVLVEGGGGVFTSFIKKNLFDEILLFISPKFLGAGLPVVNNIGIRSIRNALKLKINNCERIGDDILVELNK
ncbi:MAG: bifunctional diaminohydroxyphosphoribosylaminopyrimidine deaminase/5-amino-6-(5-phosphoribosylamino)uracil reductase RibD [Ignavibacteriaceae bacterium]|nr:bifunctional diaminohydroxyphosphoribosylaminopyrimidine deaminase/5-amino-6-(5-phosphoribosylamino)uracil reductase RibD [Ignavibacteriaceae bacterium]